MKQFSLFAALLLVMSLTLTNCKESSNIPSPGDNSYNLTSEPAPIVDAIEINIDSALKIVAGLADGETTTQKYKISGMITKNITNPTDVPKYTDINFDFKDSTDKTLTCYYTKNLRNKNFTSRYKVPLVGSYVTVVGALQRYVKNDSYTPELVNGFLYDIPYGLFLPDPITLPACPDPLPDQISIKRALAIGDSIGKGKTTTETYKIVGVVYQVNEAPSGYKNATFTIMNNDYPDETFYCYRVKDRKTGNDFTNPDMLAVGDTVFIESKITNYSGTIETVSNQGYIYWSSNKLLGYPPYSEVAQ